MTRKCFKRVAEKRGEKKDDLGRPRNNKLDPAPTNTPVACAIVWSST